jgi:hypothetical protein
MTVYVRNVEETGLLSYPIPRFGIVAAKKRFALRVGVQENQMKRKYKTQRQKRQAWYYDDDYTKVFFLVLSVIGLAVLYGLTYYATY